MANNRQRFFDVLQANKQRQAMAQRLNRAAGQELFRVFSEDELLARVTEVLAGASCIADVTAEQIELLLLPPLDGEQVREARLKYDQSDEAVSKYGPAPVLVLCGQDVTVEGHRSSTPRATLLVDWNTDLSTLTNESTTLENGARVLLKLATERGDLAESRDMPTLKNVIKGRFLEFALEKFSTLSENSAVIRIPDLASNPEAEIPEIVERVLCPEPTTGKPVMVYGVVYITQQKKLARRLAKGEKIPAHFLEFAWMVDKAKATNARQALIQTMAHWRSQRGKNESFLGTAEALVDELKKLGEELSGSRDAVVELVNDQITGFKRLNLNKGNQLAKWNDNARKCIDRGNRVIASDAMLLKRLLEQMTDCVLSHSTGGDLQDRAIEAISVIERRLAVGTLNGNLNALLAAREAVYAACESEDESDSLEDDEGEDDLD